MTNLTALEAAVLYAIAHHEMNSINGARPANHREVATWSWADAFAADASAKTGTKISTASAKGAMGSLAVKGLIWTQGTGRDAEVGFTEEGFAAFVAAFPE
jgi:hypothetical protein